MAIRVGNLPVLVMNHKFGSLILTDGTPYLNGLVFRVCMRACTLGTVPFHIPSAVRIRHNMMFFPLHYLTSFLLGLL